MEIQISDDVIEQTTRCEREFACLSGGVGDLCRIEDRISGSAAFVDCLDDRQCKYRYQFGCAWICTCPVRIVIHRRYNV
jgi:hypothetical protein